MSESPHSLFVLHFSKHSISLLCSESYNHSSCFPDPLPYRLGLFPALHRQSSKLNILSPKNSIINSIQVISNNLNQNKPRTINPSSDITNASFTSLYVFQIVIQGEFKLYLNHVFIRGVERGAIER